MLLIPQEVFLFETKPEIFVIVVDGGSAIGCVRRTVGIEHFGHDQITVVAIGVWENGDGLEQAVRIATIRLFG